MYLCCDFKYLGKLLLCACAKKVEVATIQHWIRDPFLIFGNNNGYIPTRTGIHRSIIWKGLSDHVRKIPKNLVDEPSSQSTDSCGWLMSVFLTPNFGLSLISFSKAWAEEKPDVDRVGESDQYRALDLDCRTWTGSMHSKKFWFLERLGFLNQHVHNGFQCLLWYFFSNCLYLLGIKLLFQNL